MQLPLSLLSLLLLLSFGCHVCIWFGPRHNQHQTTPADTSCRCDYLLHTLACGMLARNQFALLTHDWILLIQFAATVPRHVLCMRLHVPLCASVCVCACVCAWVLIMSACVDNRQHARSLASQTHFYFLPPSLNRIYS